MAQEKAPVTRANARLMTSSQDVPCVCSISRAITSVSRPDSNSAPASSSSRRMALKLIRLPLCAMAPWPSSGWQKGSGCAFSAREAPVVE